MQIQEATELADGTEWERVPRADRAVVVEPHWRAIVLERARHGGTLLARVHYETRWTSETYWVPECRVHPMKELGRTPRKRREGGPPAS